MDMNREKLDSNVARIGKELNDELKNIDVYFKHIFNPEGKELVNEGDGLNA